MTDRPPNIDGPEIQQFFSDGIEAANAQIGID